MCCQNNNISRNYLIKNWKTDIIKDSDDESIEDITPVTAPFEVEVTACDHKTNKCTFGQCI